MENNDEIRIFYVRYTKYDRNQTATAAVLATSKGKAYETISNHFKENGDTSRIDSISDPYPIIDGKIIW